ncbi:hypothetical protein BH20ACT17_BH20ACT17_12500 [soil metagenome]
MSVQEQATRFRRSLAADADVEVWLVVADQRLLGYASLGPSRDADAEAGKCPIKPARRPHHARGVTAISAIRARPRLRTRPSTSRPSIAAPAWRVTR